MSSASSIFAPLIAVVVLTSCRTPAPTPISQQEAAAMITAFVNKELSNRTYTPFKMFRAEDNEPRPYPKLKSDYWHTVELRRGRWTATHLAVEFAYASPDDGLIMRASVGEHGEEPLLEECRWENP